MSRMIEKDFYETEICSACETYINTDLEYFNDEHQRCSKCIVRFRLTVIALFVVSTIVFCSFFLNG